MKKGIKNIFAILILFMLLVNNSFLMIVSTAIDDIAKMIDESKINPIIESELQKYVNYKISDEQKGVLVQYKLKTGIEYKEDQQYIPIKSTKTEVNLPKIDELYPDSVEVLTNSTKATNGDNKGKDFTYKYNKESGIVEIFVENKEDDKGNIYIQNENDSRDEFVVVMNYTKETYNDKEAKRKLSFKVSMEQKLASDNNIVVRGSKGEDIGVDKNKSDLISTDIATSDIYNGFINGNIKNGTKNVTEYSENYDINFSYKQISDSVEINLVDDFLDDKDKTIDTKDLVYKSIKLNKENVLRIFGVEGSFKINNIEGQTLAEINKYTEANEDGIIEINFESELSEIFIKTTKPINNGTINIETKKEIKETMLNGNYTRILALSNITCLNNIQEKNEDTQEVIKEYEEETYKCADMSTVEIKQSETKVDVSLDKTEWTNNIQNDVNFTAVLVSNEPKYDLFKNPVIEIKLPEEVEKVVLGNVSVLYDNDIKVKDALVVVKDNQKIIKITLDGNQKDYIVNSITNGINVMIPATIILGTEINNVDKNVEITYSNVNAKILDYSNEGVNSKNINIKLLNESIPQNIENEVVEIDNYNTGIKTNDNENKENNITDVSNKEKVDVNKIKEAVSVEVEAKVGDKVLSDGDKVNEKEVIKYLIRLKNNKDYDVKGLSLNGLVPDGTNYATVDRGSYYAEEYKYVEDSNRRNVEIDNIDINANSEKTFYYEVVVQTLNGTSEKNIESNILVLSEKEEIAKYKISNVIKKAEISVNLKSYIGRDQNNSFYYYMDITNLTDHDLKNIKIETSEFQKEMSFNVLNVSVMGGSNDPNVEVVKDIKFENRKLYATIPELKAKDDNNYGMVSLVFNVLTDKFEDRVNEFDVKMNATVYVQDVEYRANENIRTAYPCYVTVVKSSDKEGEDLKYKDEINYTIKVKNEGKVKTYVTIKDNLPEELIGISAEYETYVINDVNDNIIQYDLEAEKNLAYTRKKFVKDLGYKVEGMSDIDVYTLLPAGQTIEIKIKAKADDVKDKTEIANFATVSGKDIKTTVSNTVKNNIISRFEKIDDKQNDDKDDDGNDDIIIDDDNKEIQEEINKYSIDGYAWIDKNKNGRKDSEETNLSGIIVKLFNANTNKIETNSDGESLKQKTDDNGYYKFTNINKGRYLVLFEYDTERYYLTNYKYKDVSEKLNSDVIDKEVNIDGNIKNVALSDIIDVIDSDIQNVNMGLIEREKFDLKLSKYISKVTVDNNEGTKVYNFDNQQLAKVEIGRKQITNTTVKVEYKIVVSNENDLDGYVNEVVDYKPEELDFNESENDGWSISSSNILKNTSLAGIKLAKGESKELKLVLTKKLTENSLGNIKNSAEISMLKNISNIEDFNIENNKSEASLILSVKTGIDGKIIVAVIFVTILLIVVVYCIINKKTLKVMCLIFAMILCVSVVSNADNWGNNTPNVYDAVIRMVKGDVNSFRGDVRSGGRIGHEENFECIDTGAPQCSINDHYYKLWQEYDNILSYEKTEEKLQFGMQKSDDIPGIVEKRNINNINRAVIGEYKAEIISKTNNIDKINYVFTITYRKNDNTLNTVTIDGNNYLNSNNNDIVVLNDARNLIPNGSFAIHSSNEFKFYIGAKNNVTSIEGINVKFSVSGELGVESSSAQHFEVYYIVGTASGAHGSPTGCLPSNGLYDPTHYGSNRLACQRMRRSYISSSSVVNKGSVSINLKWVMTTPISGELVVTKIDRVKRNTLTGAKFRLEDSKGNTISQNGSIIGNTSFEVDSEGKLRFTGLIIGETYKLYETQAPNDYDLTLQKGYDANKKAALSRMFTVTTQELKHYIYVENSNKSRN